MGRESPSRYGDAVRAFKRRLIRRALLRTKGSVRGTATLLGMNRTGLYKLIQQYELGTYCRGQPVAPITTAERIVRRLRSPEAAHAP